MLRALGLIFIAVVVIAYLAMPKGDRSTAAATAAKVATIDKSEAAQKKRYELIQNLMNERVFAKIETPAKAPHVWVAPRFYALDFDDKQAFVGVVYAYAYDGSDPYDLVVLKDSRSGKDIGTFTKAFGLKLD